MEHLDINVEMAGLGDREVVSSFHGVFDERLSRAVI